jgi:hypothetical protein
MSTPMEWTAFGGRASAAHGRPEAARREPRGPDHVL